MQSCFVAIIDDGRADISVIIVGLGQVLYLTDGSRISFHSRNPPRSGNRQFQMPPSPCPPSYCGAKAVEAEGTGRAFARTSEVPVRK
jgi:hypothetical protein